MQGVIAEYEKAKIAERYRRGKLYRARAGEIPFLKTSYGHRRVVPAGGGPSRIEIFEPEAEVVPRDLLSLRRAGAVGAPDRRPAVAIPHWLSSSVSPSCAD